MNILAWTSENEVLSPWRWYIMFFFKCLLLFIIAIIPYFATHCIIIKKVSPSLSLYSVNKLRGLVFSKIKIDKITQWKTLFKECEEILSRRHITYLMLENKQSAQIPLHLLAKTYTKKDINFGISKLRVNCFMPNFNANCHFIFPETEEYYFSWSWFSLAELLGNKSK